MTLLALDLDLVDPDADAPGLTVTESALARLGGAPDAPPTAFGTRAGGHPTPRAHHSRPCADAHEPPAAAPAGSTTGAAAAAAATTSTPAPRPRVRLVPSLEPATRPVPLGPASTRPPALDERILARRREQLAAERTARGDGTTRATMPPTDPTSTCCSLVLAAVEALAGTRSVAQLARWVTPEVYDALAGRAALTLRALGTSGASRRPEVRRVRVCRLGDHVAEASVVVDDGRRVRAAAVRLETWRGAWRAVVLEIG